MKKPVKPASKGVPVKKGTMTKTTAKKVMPAKKMVSAPIKGSAKVSPKSTAKSLAKTAVKAVVKIAAKTIAKTTSKPPAKVKVPQKNVQKNIQKKIHDKIAFSKKAVLVKAAKKEAAIKKGLGGKKPITPSKKTGKKIEVAKIVHKKELVKIIPAKKEISEKMAKTIEKPIEKTPVKVAEKITAKIPEKKVGKVATKISAKKDEKEQKVKGKKDISFEEEQEEEANKKARIDDDEGEDEFETPAPKKIKMTFDEDIEEEIIPVRKKSKSGLDDDVKESLAEEILALSEDFSIEEVFASIKNMDLFRLETDECVVRGCDNPATTNGYCRYHYIKMWKDVKKKELILSEGRLAKMIEDLVRKYPMKYIETIIHDLADDKAFNHVLKDLDIETDENEIDAFDDDELLDDDQDIAFETKVVKPSFDD